MCPIIPFDFILLEVPFLAFSFFKNVSTFTVVSFDGEKVVECNAHDLRCTRKDAELVEVEFEDGLVVRCTPDHKFLSLTPEVDSETYEAYFKVEWKPAAYLTMKTVRKAYTCPIIKSNIIKLEEVEGVITESDAKNSFVKVISVKHLDYKEDVYCMTVDNTHCFALENGVVAHNCCGHDLARLLAEGFNTRQTDIRPAGSINTAFQLVAVIFQLQSLQQFGGVSATHIDWTMVPYVRKSFRKHWNDGLRYIAFWPVDEKQLVTEDRPINEYIDGDDYKDIYRYALDMTEKELNQAVEAMYHNLNTL